MSKTAISRLTPAQLNEFDAVMLSWANRLARQSELKRFWPAWYANTLVFLTKPDTRHAAELVKAYLTYTSTRQEFAKLPAMSRRICLRTIARLEERLTLFGGTRNA